MQDLNWLQQVGTFVGTYGLAVFLVVYYVLRMYPQVSAERREWIAEITRLEQLVNPDTRPITLSQAEVVGDIAIEAYMNRLSTLTAVCNWRGGKTMAPGFGGPPKGFVSRAFLGEEFIYNPEDTDATGLRKLIRRFSDAKKRVNEERAGQLTDLIKHANESAEKIQYQLAQLKFQEETLATPWHMALTSVKDTWELKVKELDFVDSYDRRRFLEFVQDHPAYDHIKEDQDLTVVIAENPFSVEDLLDLVKNVMKSSLYAALGKRTSNRKTG